MWSLLESNGGGDILVANNSHTGCLMGTCLLLPLPLRLSTKSMQPFEEIGVLSVLAKMRPREPVFIEILNGLSSW